MAYVYMLECADGTLYTGWTVDLEKRIERHNAGTASKYTRSRRPVTLRYHERHENRSEALRREVEIKRLNRDAKWALIEQQERKE